MMQLPQKISPAPRTARAVLVLLCAAGALHGARAQTVTYTENFTGTSTTNSWYFFQGACLTAGGSVTTSPGPITSCASLANAYYSGQTLVGGDTGLLPDNPVVGGALRLTNSSLLERGAILSDFSFPLSSQGLQVTFTTESYGGNGSGGDGADGISFFLQDALKSVDRGKRPLQCGKTAVKARIGSQFRHPGPSPTASSKIEHITCAT